MAKHTDSKIVKFVGFSELNGGDANGACKKYLDSAGMLCIFESQNKDPGKKFVYFFPSEPDSVIQRYFHTSMGELTETDDKICFESNHRYIFEKGSFISQDEAKTILMNVFERDLKQL